MRPEVYVLLERAARFARPRGRHAVLECVVLERALAGLIADRAVERVVHQQQLHDAFAGAFHSFGVGAHDHPVAHACVTGDLQLRQAFDLHLTQAAGTVEAAVRDGLEHFLHPLLGGPEGRGWEEGRNVYLSDVAAVLERITGVDYARELRLYIDGRLQGEQARVPTGKTVVAGEIQIKLVI